MLGIAASEGAKSLAHSLSFGVTLAVLTNLAQHTFHQKPKTGTHWQRYGPTYLVCLSVPLVMADLTRHVLQDANMLGRWSHMYRQGCGHDDIRCLSWAGWLFSIVLNYSGFICLIIGSLWSVNLIAKVRIAWRKARGASRS
mmetsp:Transcript_18015/g.58828  ORF Transcript_18015/g.58828 Transcript_18015/m.58828 type:complete len:141 (-) Transcript_18015:377-799(-)